VHIAVLGNAGSWYCGQLKHTARSRGHRCTRIDFRQLIANVGASQSLVSGNDWHLGEAQARGLRPAGDNQGRQASEKQIDAAIVRTMPAGSLEQVVYRMDALASVQAAGTIVLNPPKALECAVDKYLTTARLAAAGLPVPETAVCESADEAMSLFALLGGDVVVKPLFGAEGRGILRVGDPDLALRAFRSLERIGAVLYLQQYVEHEGFDVRAMVLDGRILGGMRRISEKDFRTNISRDARAEPHALTDMESQLALSASATVGTRFAGVDLLYGRDGRCYVIEVNAVPGWRAFQKATGCDVATRVIESLEQCSSKP
jgi:ribosomal protein S6--L-glutamate ligase